MPYIYGVHAVKTALFQKDTQVQELFILKSKTPASFGDLMKKVDELKIPYRFVEKSFLDKLSEEGNHQGIAASFKEGFSYKEKDIPGLIEAHASPLILVLDSVQDPHNLGACLRSADAAGVTCVIAPRDGAASLTPTVRKIACGAAETMPFIAVTNLVRTLELLKEARVWCYGFAEEGQSSLYTTSFPKSVALVMGAEGQGLRRLVRDACDELVSIPMAGTVSSLNVSVATGVALFEVVRQRGIKKS